MVLGFFLNAMSVSFMAPSGVPWNIAMNRKVRARFIGAGAGLMSSL